MSLAAVSNATIDLGRAGAVTTETDDVDDGETSWFEDMSALNPSSSFSRDLILPTIPEEDFSSRSEIRSVAWLRLSATEHGFKQQNLQRDHLERNLHISCAIGYPSL